MALGKYLNFIALELEAKVLPELQSDGARFSLRSCQRILIRAAADYEMLAAAESQYSTTWAARGSMLSTPENSLAEVRNQIERYLQTLSTAASSGRVELDGFPDFPKALILRMDQPGSSTGTTLRDEFPVLQYIFLCGLKVPRPFLFEPTGSVLGEPFILVAQARGSPAGGPLQGPVSAHSYGLNDTYRAPQVSGRSFMEI